MFRSDGAGSWNDFSLSRILGGVRPPPPPSGVAQVGSIHPEHVTQTQQQLAREGKRRRTYKTPIPNPCQAITAFLVGRSTAPPPIRAMNVTAHCVLSRGLIPRAALRPAVLFDPKLHT